MNRALSLLGLQGNLHGHCLRMAASALLDLDPLAPPELETVCTHFQIVSAGPPAAVDALWDSERSRYWSVEAEDNRVAMLDGENSNSKKDGGRLAVTSIRDSKIKHGCGIRVAGAGLKELAA